jgi:hypothetical protein
LRKITLPTKIENVKTHFKENKKLYIGIGIGVAVGVTATVVLAKMDVINVTDSFKLELGTIKYKSPTTTNNIVVTELARRGHPGNMIMCNETGEVFASQARAASANSVNPASLSKHLSGKLDNVKGLTFSNLGEAV